MRILLVNAHGADPTYGGAERYVRDLAAGLSARGHEVEVLSAFPQPGEPEVETHVLHETDWREDPLRRFRNHVGDVASAPWPRLGTFLRAASPDLVHTNNLPGIATGVWEAARRAGIPVVHTILDYYLLCPRTTLTRRDGHPCRPHPLLCGARTRRLTRWNSGVRAVISLSEHLLGMHRGLFPRAQECIIRLPLAQLDGAPPGPPQPPQPPLTTLGYLGALNAAKGVELLLTAAPSLAAEGIELRIAGDGPLRQRVSAAGAQYVGRLEGPAKTKFLMSCDLGVVPSLWEEPGGPPYVVPEWLAAGRPVLATRRGGLREATRCSGVIPFDASPAALVETTLRLRQENEWRRVLATVPVVDGDADVQRWLDEHEALYEAAVYEIVTRART